MGRKLLTEVFPWTLPIRKKTENPLLSKPESVLPAKQAEEGEKTK